MDSGRMMPVVALVRGMKGCQEGEVGHAIEEEDDESDIAERGGKREG
jgi:hypothetical protein